MEEKKYKFGRGKEDEAVNEAKPTSEQTVDVSVVYEGVELPNKSSQLKKFKKIDNGVYAMPIDTVGTIVAMEQGVVFVPEAAITVDDDGDYKLVRGRKFAG